MHKNNTSVHKVDELRLLVADEQNRCDYLDGVLKDLRWWAKFQNIVLPEYANCQEPLINWHIRRKNTANALNDLIS